jgi:hypothetical protein
MRDRPQARSLRAPAAMVLALASVLAAGCFTDPSGVHPCDACQECESCVQGLDGPSCQAASHASELCVGDEIHWLDSCGVDEGAMESCPAHSACADDGAGGASCVCTNHWTGESCAVCPDNWDPTADCAACETHWIDEDNDCGTCPANWDATANCAACLNHWIDEGDDCGTCPPNWDPAADCDACLTHWTGADCESCPGNWDPAANCDACLNHWVDDGDDCGTCPPNWDPGQDCNACLGNWNVATGCTTCVGNWDLASGCTDCVGNWDPVSDCAVCENEWVDEGNDCGTCPPEYLPEDDCMAQVCGNGHVETGEECDDGNDIDWDGCNDCAIAELLVAAVTGSQAVAPAVALADDGGLVVAWSLYTPIPIVEVDVYARRIAADGSMDDPAFLVNTWTDDWQGDAVIGAAGDGRFAVAWYSRLQDGSEGGVFGQRFDADGTPAGPEFQVNDSTSGDQFLQRIGMDDTGRFVVAWIGQEPYTAYDFRAYGKWYAADGTSGAEIQLNDAPDEHETMPDVAVAADGAAAFAWSGLDADADGVFFRRFDSSGGALGDPIPVNTYTLGTQFMPSIAISADGGYAIVWVSLAQVDDGFGWGHVFGQLFDSDGATVGAETQISTTDSLDQTGPRMVALSDGGFWVVWEETDGTEANVVGQRLDATLEKVGGELHVNLLTAGFQGSPAIATNAGGELAVVWSSDLPDGSGDTGIYAQRYAADGTPMGVLPW